MAQKPSEKLQTSAPVRPVPNDPDRLFMSRDEVLAKDRKLKEIEAKLDLERKKLEEQYEKEQEALEKIGAEELASSVKKPKAKKDLEEE